MRRIGIRGKGSCGELTILAKNEKSELDYILRGLRAVADDERMQR